VKILVTVKRVPDPDQKIKLSPDGTRLDTDGLPFVVNPFDAIAVEEAIRIRERSSDPIEIVAVSIGGEACEEQLRTALAMGADRGVRVDVPQTPDPWNVAGILQAVVQHEQPNLILMGKQAVDDDSNQVGQFLAARLDWPQATFASKIEFVNGRLEVDRETDAGIERVRVALPAVITTDLRLNEPRYVSLPGIVRARKKPLETLSLEQLGVTVRPRVELLGVSIPTSARTGVRVQDVDQLVLRLKEARVV
jgi:electron transfer flavoprotein beta subunit